jgi:recombination protein RecR
MKRYRVEAFDKLVEAFDSLPSIGRKSALRLAYHIVLNDSYTGLKLAHAIEDAVGRVRRCSRCHNISQDEYCDICSDSDRDRAKLCIVQNVKDVDSIESAGMYDGMYYVLESVDDLDEEHLNSISEGVEEIIFAFPPGIATDMMMLHIENKLEGRNIRFSRIAQGVPTGVELDNIDTLSLSRAMEDRVRV